MSRKDLEVEGLRMSGNGEILMNIVNRNIDNERKRRRSFRK